MTKLKLSDLADDKPVRVTIDLPASVHRLAFVDQFEEALEHGIVIIFAPECRSIDPRQTRTPCT